jgi:hypothetical protein
VIPYFLADKGIWIFPPDVACGADLVPPRQQFFLFHFRPPSAGTRTCRYVFEDLRIEIGL